MAGFSGRLFAAELRRMRESGPPNREYWKPCYGEVPSLWLLDAVQEVARVAMATRNIRDYLSSREFLGLDGDRYRVRPGFATAIFQLCQNPWRIPTETELDNTAKRLPHYVDGDHHRRRLRSGWVRDEGFYRFSAAAIATHFLESMPAPARQLHADHTARPVAQWICEASLLPKQITLIFDCDGTPGRTAEVFQDVIQRDAAWQTALDRAFGCPDGSTDPNQPNTPARIRAVPAYHCEGFPELLRAMCHGDPDSRVRCDGFDPGCPWDDDQIQGIVEGNQGLTADEWGAAWARDGVGYSTAPPLPDFQTLLDENVVEK
ncbi:hypothetical protein B0T16DRAFT_396044 [Cercophora newfieldiana]|uniref:Uncharacterized protein n=1 Tax=Cercophora newfieldiana TaxID=92897 RepID=A0AA39YNU1_9PEZI|nr:hypothetical protein B0T16DRAFT_396044 [Cercophora newfieldiana]